LAAPDNFVHLRIRSNSSILESSVQIDALFERCAVHAMPAAALLDTNNMYSALEFAAKAVAAGIQPIHGCSVSLRSPGAVENGMGIPPLGLLAMDHTGYQNLLTLSTRMYLSPDRPIPCLHMTDLEECGEGLICLTGGANGILGSMLLEGRTQSARSLLETLKQIFPDRLYVEIQRHPHEGTTCAAHEEKTETPMIEMAYDLELPLVATNDVQFLDSDAYDAVDLLFYIKHGGYATQHDKRRLLTREHGLKTPAEMADLFADLPEAIENTGEIARRCRFNTRTRSAMLPKFSDNEDEDLRRRAEEGLAWRLGTHEPATSRDEYEQRLNYELSIIRQKGFSGYYLIVHDFVVWAKEQDIPVGPGRGSGVGSLVAFALRITNLDPIRYSLLFERFLNPERDSIPDFDIDFCQECRGRVVDYVCGRYGADRVAQIITFGTLGAKAAIRDFGRILRIPRGKLVALSDEVDSTRRLRDQVETNPVLAAEVQSNDEIRDLFDHIDKIEGLPRNTSRHPAGVVIGNQPLQQILPLQNDDPEQMPTTQFDMKWTEKAGLVKMDFLGLQTLSTINHTLTTLRDDGIEIDLDAIGLDDPDVFALYASGYTLGVFQVESGGMVDSLRMMKPNKIEDIIALLALYRPGPMANIPDYCQVKHGEKPSKHYHPLIDDLLDETNGIIVYQEQVMEIARQMGGYTRGHADILRKAMGKKLPEEMAREKPRFINGARQKGVSAGVAERVWKLLEKFAEYGFNKAHAAGYAATSYQTAWLKCKYPAPFMASAMTYEREITDEIATYARELIRLGIDLEPPCINRSVAGFRSEGKVIHYALDAIKGVGTEVARMIVKARGDTPFADMFDFARRANLQLMNRGAVEQLVLAGVFDRLEPNRRAIHSSIDRLFAYHKNAVEQEKFQRDSLFNEKDDTLSKPELVQTDDWSPAERLASEMQVLGMYISGHPLDAYEMELGAMDCCSIANVTAVLRKGPEALSKKYNVKVAGVLASVNHRQSSTNKRMAIVKMADRTDEIEAFVFPQDLEDTPIPLTESICVSAYLNVKTYNERLSVNVTQIRPLSRKRSLPRKTLGIYYNTESVPSRILTILDEARGTAQPELDVTVRLCPIHEGMQNQVEIVVPRRFRISRTVPDAINQTDGVVDLSVT